VALAAIIFMDDIPIEDRQPMAAGMALPAYQARQALLSGARHIIIHSAVVSRQITRVCEELRGEGVSVSLVRNPAELAGSIHPEERALVFAPDYLFPIDLVAHVAAQEEPLLCVQAATQGENDYLIDRTLSWSGLAVLPGELVRKVADLPGEWSMEAALLRLAVQSEAEHLAIGLEIAHRITDQDSVNRALAGIAAVSKAAGQNTPQDRLSAMIGSAVNPLAYRLFGWGVDHRWTGLATSLVAIAALCTGWFGGASAGLFVVLCALFLAHIFQAMSLIALRDGRWVTGVMNATLLVVAALILLLGYQNWQASGQWGFLALSSWILGNVLALGLHRRPMTVAALTLMLAALGSSGWTVAWLTALAIVTSIQAVRSALARN
jgi:hypothetical protein